MTPILTHGEACRNALSRIIIAWDVAQIVLRGLNEKDELAQRRTSDQVIDAAIKAAQDAMGEWTWHRVPGHFELVRVVNVLDSSRRSLIGIAGPVVLAQRRRNDKVIADAINDARIWLAAEVAATWRIGHS